MPLLLLAVALLGHSVLWVGIVNRAHGMGLVRWLVDGTTFACVAAFGLVPATFIAFLLSGETVSSLQTGGGIIAWYLTLCVLIATVATIARIYTALHSERRGVLLRETERLLDLHEPELAAPGMVRRLVGLPGNQVLCPAINEKELFVPRLPEELDGLRVAHLSDLHMSGRIGVEYFVELMQATLAAQPDLIALTGDLVEYTPQLEWLDRTILQLNAPDGVFFVLGNHDEKHIPEQLKQRLTAGGQVDLGGRAVERVIRGKRIRFVGNELPWFPPAGDPRGDGSPVELTIALAHCPDQFRWAENNDIDLILAGHNHGGQIRVPLLGALVTPSRFGTRYTCGIFKRSNTVMHVSRGAGSLAPLRFNCRPEVSLLVLRHQAL